MRVELIEGAGYGPEGQYCAVLIPKSVRVRGNVLHAGRYIINIPNDYTADEVTAEDILLDDQISVVLYE